MTDLRDELAKECYWQRRHNVVPYDQLTLRWEDAKCSADLRVESFDADDVRAAYRSADELLAKIRVALRDVLNGMT